MELFNNILYVSEASVTQQASIARAVSLAENNQATLSVIDVVPAITAGARLLPGGRTPKALQDAMVNERLNKLKALIAPYKDSIDIRLDVLVGTTFLQVIHSVLHNEHDLVIKPAENPSFIERLFGSDDMQLLRNCPCPVWLIPAGKESEYSCILAAVDLNPDMPDAVDETLNQQILDLSGSLALSAFTELHFVHAWDAPGEITVLLWSDNANESSSSYVEGVRASHQAALDRFREQLRAQVSAETYRHLSPQFHLRRGSPSTVIPEMIKQLESDLVIMGTVARTGISGLLIGNTAEAILEQVQCSVLAIKPSGFVSPVKLNRP